jgi:type II secretory pathway component PulJ
MRTRPFVSISTNPVHGAEMKRGRGFTFEVLVALVIIGVALAAACAALTPTSSAEYTRRRAGRHDCRKPASRAAVCTRAAEQGENSQPCEQGGIAFQCVRRSSRRRIRFSAASVRVYRTAADGSPRRSPNDDQLRQTMKSRGPLLELLVAITVLSIADDRLARTRLSVTTWVTRAEADDVRALLTTFGQMERDLAQVTNPKFLGLATSPITVSVADGTTMLQLARIAPSAPDRPTEVQTVVYRVVDGTLVRQASPALPAFERVTADKLETARLLGRVKLMQVRMWSQGVGWIDPQRAVAAGSARRVPNTNPVVRVETLRRDTAIFKRDHGGRVNGAFKRRGAASLAKAAADGLRPASSGAAVLLRFCATLRH